MILTLAIAQGLDALTLAGMVVLGLPEGNPFVAELLARAGLGPVLALKVALVVLVVATIRVCLDRPRGARVGTARALGLIALSAGVVGTVSNLATIAWWPG